MANQPPVRPWFRLGSIRAATVPPPPSTPAPAPPPPEPRPFMSLPTFRTASAPPSPLTQPRDPTPPAAPEPALRLVPSDVRVSAPSSPVQQQRYSAPSSPQSPRTIKQASPRQSPKLTPSAPPPSPLTLPPSQARSEARIPTEAEPKTVLVQKSVDKARHWVNGERGEHRSHPQQGKHVSAEAKEKGVHKKVSDSEESGMRVITIAGENRGAYMELVQSQKKQEHKKGGEELESTGGGEGRAETSLPMSAYMNSNVQCVNNSLLYHASCSHHDPGVRLSLTKKPFGEGYHLKERVEGHEVA